MKATACFLLALFLLTGCFRTPGRIIVQNGTSSNLVIGTSPIIRSGSGGWENGIWYYNADSIIWKYTLGNNIHAKILWPKYWKDRDSVFAQARPDGCHFSGYSDYRYDTTVNALYAMYPGSSFTIGYTDSYRKIIAHKDHLRGRFTIKKLTIYRNRDTLAADNPAALWKLLLENDANPAGYSADGTRKKSKDIIILIKQRS